MGTALVTTLLAVWLAAVGDPLAARAGGEEPAPPAPEATPPAEPAEAELRPPPAEQRPSCLDRTVDAVQARYEKVSDLRAHFV